MEVNEKSLKAWLMVLSNWVDIYKSDDEKVFSFDKNGYSLCMEFLKHFAELQTYLNQLVQWLLKKGVEEAIKEIPAVGKLLSQLCKLPLVHLNAHMNESVIENMLMVSNLLKQEQHESEMSSTKRQPKIWTINHFSLLTNYFGEGVDMFLMEELGISQQEYMEEHLAQILQEIKESLMSTGLAGRHLGTMKLFIELAEIMDSEIVLYLIEDFLKLCYCQPEIIIQSSIKKKHHIPKTLSISAKKHLLSINGLRNMYICNYSAIEELIINLISDLRDDLLVISEKCIVNRLSKHQLISLCNFDMNIKIVVMEILRSSILVMGNHPYLLLIVKALNKYVEHKDLQSSVERKTGVLEKDPWELPMEYRGECLQQIKKTFLDRTTNEMMFKTWFCLASHMKWIDQAVLLLFNENKKLLQACLQLLLFFFNPIDYHTITNMQITVLSSYVSNLQQLLSKKHLQLVDLQCLFASLKENISKNFSWVLLIVNLMFLLKSKGGKGVVEGFFNEIIIDWNEIKVFWIFYVIELYPLKNEVSREILKQTVEKCNCNYMQMLQKRLDEFY